MTELANSVSRVTVYPDRARVTRLGSISLEPGRHQLEIRELPLSINPDSVRASARGTARARLHGVQVERDYFVETPSVDVRRLEEQIDSLQDDQHLLEARMELVRQNRLALDALLGQTQVYATALASGEMSVDEQMSIFDGLRQRAEKLNAELNEIQVQRRSLEKQIEKLRKELQQQSGARPRQRYSARVDVEVLQAGELHVALTYVLSGASWKPLYDLRLLEDGQDRVVEVAYLAQVAQRGGETWQDIFLTLSTARPALSSHLPELEPWYIQPRPLVVPMAAPAQAKRTREMKLTAEDSMAGSATMPEVEAMAEEVSASVDSSGGAVTYRVPGKVSIPSDGDPHKVAIARFELPPRLDYLSAPKLVEAVYRRARLLNDSPYTLLPGQTNLFNGDEFIGSSHLDLTAPQGEIELYLGVDDQIRVKRELKRRDVDKTLIGGRRRLHYGYEIEVENLSAALAHVSLHDQIPVGRHEEIKVRLNSVDPRPVEQTELGLLKWEFELEPKEKRVLRFDITVEFPQSMDIIGLP